MRNEYCGKSITLAQPVSTCLLSRAGIWRRQSQGVDLGSHFCWSSCYDLSLILLHGYRRIRNISTSPHHKATESKKASEHEERSYSCVDDRIRCRTRRHEVERSIHERFCSGCLQYNRYPVSMPKSVTNTVRSSRYQRWMTISNNLCCGRRFTARQTALRRSARFTDVFSVPITANVTQHLSVIDAASPYDLRRINFGLCAEAGGTFRVTLRR